MSNKKNNKKFTSKARNFLSSSHNDTQYKIFNGELFPEKYFGQPDADVEWSENTDLCSELFVHTVSYTIIKQKTVLYIYGRRGTGKTALIKMLDYEIKKGMVPDYNYSKIIKQEDTFYKQTLALRTISEKCTGNELRNILKEKMKWVIYTSAMVSVLEKHKGDYTNHETLTLIAKYLQNQNLFPSFNKLVITSPIKLVNKILQENIEEVNFDTEKSGIALLKSNAKLYSKEYEAALNSLVLFLTEKKETCLILIDSQELYEFRDDISKAAIAGLIDAVSSIFIESSNCKVYAKAAFPSEIYPHFDLTNHGKTNDKEHVIFWRYKDLLALIAKRYCHCLKKEKLISEGCESIENTNYNNFLERFIPKNTFSFSEIEFATIPYILSHTQKKPREIILLFNLILTLAEINKIPFNKITSDCIREGTNGRIEDLGIAAIDMYKQIYPNTIEIINKTFFGRKNILSYGELHQYMNEANSILGDLDMQKWQVERLFLEIGIIGLIQVETEKYYKEKSIVVATYEYQIKSTLTLQSKHELAIHPMFYQHLNIQVDSDSLIYPKPSQEEHDEEEAIRISLRK